MSWTSGETIIASRLEDKNDRSIANGYAVLDANIRISRDYLPSFLRSALIGTIAWEDVTVVAGSWGTGAQAGQTDWDMLWYNNVEAGWRGNNGSDTDLDEIKISSLNLNAGTYEIKVVVIKNTNAGILEVLHGAASLGTYDMYAAAIAYNQVATFNYSPTVRTDADLRFRVNNKNASSSSYTLRISRIQIRKTA